MSPNEEDKMNTFTERFMKEGVEGGEKFQSLQSINHVIQRHSYNASVVFTTLISVPAGQVDALDYVSSLDVLSRESCCLLIACGGACVTSTNLREWNM